MTLAAELAAVGVEDVSRETCDRLRAYADLARRWGRRINLVSRGDLDAFESRHIVDCAQLDPLAGDVPRWVDIGAGGGLPGLVIAILREARNPDFRMTLVEADERKCLFMEEVARQLSLRATVLRQRIEEGPDAPFPVVSARALAPLDRLWSWARPWLAPGGVCLFPKGERVHDELTALPADPNVALELIPSRTRKGAYVVRMKESRDD